MHVFVILYASHFCVVIIDFSVYEQGHLIKKINSDKMRARTCTKKFNTLVAFDFDNTITQDIIGHNIHDKSYLDIMGGQERLDHLKALFETLTNEGVQITIVY